MWLFTKYGFVSVVQKRGDAHLTVRSRARKHLDLARQHYWPELSETRKTPNADYGYRATIGHAEFAHGLARAGLDITYDNYKAEVTRVLGQAAHEVFMRVWSVLVDGRNKLDGVRENMGSVGRKPRRTTKQGKMWE